MNKVEEAIKTENLRKRIQKIESFEEEVPRNNLINKFYTTFAA